MRRLPVIAAAPGDDPLLVLDPGSVRTSERQASRIMTTLFGAFSASLRSISLVATPALWDLVALIGVEVARDAQAHDVGIAPLVLRSAASRVKVNGLLRSVNSR